MKEERNALNEQMEALHTEVAKIAKIMANIHTTEKAIDQKATVIGRALVSQKELSKQIQENQSEQGRLLQDYNGIEKDRQKEVLEAIAEVAQSLADLADTETKKQILTDSLERLSEEQQSFMEENREFSKRASEELEEVKRLLKSMKETGEKMELADQVRFINGKTEEMKKILTAYVEKRTRITAAMARQTQETKSQIADIAQLMETQREKVEKIVAISNSYEAKTTQLCEILEELLDEVRMVKEEEESPSLEDLFGEQPKPETLEPKLSESGEHILLPEDAEDVENVEDKIETKPSGISETDTEPIFHDTEEDENSLMDDKRKAKKKKGLFSRLFGGK